MQYFTPIPLNEIPEEHPVRVFQKIWGSLFENGDPVNWSCFNPMKTPGVLPWTVLLDCLEGEDYRYRICGTGCQHLFGADQTGKPFGERVDNVFVSEAKQQMQAIKAGAEPLFHVGSLAIRNREHIQVVRGMYGFSTDGKTIDRILGIIAPPRDRRVVL